MTDEVFISTEMVDADTRIDFWRQTTKPIFDTMPVSEGGANTLEGTIRSRVLGPLQIGLSSFNAQRYNRDRRIIIQSGLDHYLVQVFLSGSMKGDFNGVSVNANVGDICVLDLAYIFRSEVDAGSRLSLAIPRWELEKEVGARNLHGAVLKAEHPMTRMITTCLRETVSSKTLFSEYQLTAVQEAVITLLSAAFRGEMPETMRTPRPGALSLRQRVLAFIEQNIHSKDLSPEFIQRRFNVSRAHLYRAFATDGGVAKVLQDRRLDLALLKLTRKGGSSDSISTIAASLGFSSGNQLLRSFRARFGMTPSEAREKNAALSRNMPGPLHLQTHFAQILSHRLSDQQRTGPAHE